MALLWTRKTWQKVEALFDPPLENWMVVFNQSSKKSNSTEKRNFSFWLRERKKTWWTPNLVWRHNINFVSMEWYSQSIVHPLKRESVCSLFCRSQGKCNLSKILVFKPMRRTKVSKVQTKKLPSCFMGSLDNYKSDQKWPLGPPMHKGMSWISWPMERKLIRRIVGSNPGVGKIFFHITYWRKLHFKQLCL